MAFLLGVQALHLVQVIGIGAVEMRVGYEDLGVLAARGNVHHAGRKRLTEIVAFVLRERSAIVHESLSTGVFVVLGAVHIHVPVVVKDETATHFRIENREWFVPFEARREEFSDIAFHFAALTLEGLGVVGIVPLTDGFELRDVSSARIHVEVP